MHKWRYKSLVIRELALADSKLNAEGEKGWELITVCMTDHTTARAFFKQSGDSEQETHHEEERLIVHEEERAVVAV